MRSGTVAVIGKANAGKSTLVNVLVGEKVAIVSPKPQTTRDRILGILNREDRQIVFVDTPGIYRQRNALTGIMMRTTENTSRDVDAILYVHDGHAGVEESDIALMKKYASLGIPMLIAYTKTDIMQKERIPEDVKKIVEGGVERDIFPVSARKGSNLKKLEDAVAALLPEGEPLFPEDVVSDRSEKFMIAEIMREKILLKFDQEIPHGVAIVINTFEKQDNGVYDINLDIVCEKPNHKAILIGRQGRALKEVASFARQDMEKFLGAKVFLTTYVKVRENWRDREGMLRELGYEKERED
ncbi:MAG: GTPase Era [Bacillota bacterium]|uniref:GTPase Era n=1 Tax=Candidatus Gallimonas intestinavium TaxID=2838603 RepID=A0A9D2G3R1_9FIRM|nr:MAG: GTPase Era [Bacillota bacterium]HIZ72544.1 GTPase Era [Candidatus Gallimonas intestinavium]